MKISYNWLKEYIEFEQTPEQIAEVLVNLGLEVEGMEEFHSVKGGLKGFVIGEVITCKKHPNADKLSVTTVNAGTGSLLNIVCGAPNVAAGQKVVVATVGTMIYKGNDSFEIKKAKIRGEESEGMICAEDEIGIGTSHEGILVLPPEAVVGTPAAEYFKVVGDVRFEIGLTPNRIGSGSHYGIARDLAAYFTIAGNLTSAVKAHRPFVDEFETDNKKLFIDVQIENEEACPRYAGVTLSGVTVKPSPEWLQNRLKAIGLNPINNVVDVTNYVLHELGQPLHAFDASEIKGEKIVVKTLPEGTKFVTLDGVERTLSAEDLMICNANEGMAIGGVFGGLHSGITEKTVNIFIESAYFNPVSVRKTARRHGLSTDASFHFERGTDPNMVTFALKRAALLIRETGGGSISSEIIDRYPKPISDFMVEVSWERMYALIGKKIDKAIVRQILNSLEMLVEREKDDVLLVRVPPYHVDVKKEADIVEEVLRIYGYNNVEFPDKVLSTLSYVSRPDKEKVQFSVSEYLSGHGYNEIMSNSLTKSSYYTGSVSFPEEQLARIYNPLSSDLNCMRQTLLFGGLEAIIYNINRKSPDLNLYEFGNCYFMGKTNGKDALGKYSEEMHLGLFITGNKSYKNWASEEKPSSFYTLRSTVHFLLEKLGIAEDSIIAEEFESDVFSEALRYTVKKGQLVDFGIVHPSLLQKFDIQAPVYFADFQWKTVIEGLKDHKVLYRELPKYPEVRRDLSLMLNEQVKFSELRKVALETEKNLIRRVDLFDVYMGDQVEKGKKSYALSFILQDLNKTLTDAEIDRIMEKVMKAYADRLGAVVRK